ncbi:sigma-70 family RNA polymerase sigma factor [Actinophytocola gossypii]|uniref:Sigma-70 family RNA polymerase sigma factor n=1 Tax=Actinophytocola gossypii TaxID=2812003 RepID=A0ABT2J4X9_9PSEU|nr:sigma-70 family RNA polymerase sigma factor [Actinophytocola gossypii]MCT2582929.1 sigma-70 family RNA polymerase sigma factor [Actinophytocola gossypii]
MNWGQLYTDYRETVAEVARRGLRGRCDAENDADDVVNDVFAAVLTNPPPTPCDWQALLVDITVRQVRRRMCRPGRGAAPLTIDDLAGLADDLVVMLPVEDAAMIAIRRVNAGEVRKRILRVMDYMTDRQRQITRLRLFEGLSVGEIAQAMNTSSSNISQIVIRCLAKLQPVLTQFDTFDEDDLEGVRPPRRPY